MMVLDLTDVSDETDEVFEDLIDLNVWVDEDDWVVGLNLGEWDLELRWW